MEFAFHPVEWVQLTAAYSNAVAAAILPHLNDAALKLELPLALPIERPALERFFVMPHRGKVEGSAILTNDWILSFQEGHFAGFERPGGFFSEQDPESIPKYYGPLRMTANEAVQLARNTIQRLGVSLDDVLAEQEPKIEQARGVGTNVVPHFRIEWHDPRGGVATGVEVDANQCRVQRLQFFGRRTLDRPPPEVAVQPARLPPGHPLRAQNDAGGVNLAYAVRLVPHVLSAIEDWARRLDWNLPLPVTTNHVRRFYISDQGGWPHCEVTFTNGWLFKYRGTNLTLASSPRSFFESDRLPFRFRDYTGAWRLTEAQAIERARQEIAKLGHPGGPLHTEGDPRVFRPDEIQGMPSIPRLQVEWNWPSIKERTQWIQVEVDCDRGTVETIYVDDGRWWGRGPPIDLPISDQPVKSGIRK